LPKISRVESASQPITRGRLKIDRTSGACPAAITNKAASGAAQIVRWARISHGLAPAGPWR